MWLIGLGVGEEWATDYAGVGSLHDGKFGGDSHPNPLPGRERGRKGGARPFVLRQAQDEIRVSERWFQMGRGYSLFSVVETDARFRQGWVGFD